jgi:hypothetical protein
MPLRLAASDHDNRSRSAISRASAGVGCGAMRLRRKKHVQSFALASSVFAKMEFAGGSFASGCPLGGRC